MILQDYGDFDALLNEHASVHQLHIANGELEGYWRALMRFSISVVETALTQAPAVYPAWFPTAQELQKLCEEVAANDRERPGRPDSIEEKVRMQTCGHVFDFEPEPEGSRFAGFEVCRKCSLSRPVLRQVVKA